MDLDERLVRDDMHNLRNELTALRGNAQLLLRRLRREPGECSRHIDACETIIEQTQMMEHSINRFAAKLSSQDWVRVDHEVPQLRESFQPEA